MKLQEYRIYSLDSSAYHTTYIHLRNDYTSKIFTRIFLDLRWLIPAVPILDVFRAFLQIVLGIADRRVGPANLTRIMLVLQLCAVAYL